MNSELSDSLRSLEKQLRRAGRAELLCHLSPGVPPAETRAALASVGLGPSHELERLYGWHDGSWWESGLTLGQKYLFPWFVFPPLGDATSSYSALMESGCWEPTWFPVFEDGGGGYYVVDFGPAQFGAVRSVDEFPEQGVIEHRSLAAMAQTLSAAYETGTFFVDAEGGLQRDYDGFVELAGQLNPDVRWWHDSEYRSQ
ncbi:MAG: hypothetical protein LBC97_02335 [Bifidobacteriaceae bacterium]|jgi:cell wall assembly regulator SMI1|nr:hypothetical protein [Bifidobacteriaceae bacterium]